MTTSMHIRHGGFSGRLQALLAVTCSLALSSEAADPWDDAELVSPTDLGEPTVALQCHGLHTLDHADISDHFIFQLQAGREYVIFAYGDQGELIPEMNFGVPVPIEYSGFLPFNFSFTPPQTGDYTLNLSLPATRVSARYYLCYYRVKAPADAVVNDFDDDRVSDLTAFNGGTFEWNLQLSRLQFTHRGPGFPPGTYPWPIGQRPAHTIPAPGDYDGDGLAEMAIYDKDRGRWYFERSATTEIVTQDWGWSQVIPVPADYDGDGKTDIAVYHPSRGDWYILQSATYALRKQQFGWSASIPVPADYDGDGKTDIAVYYPGAGNWYFLDSGTGRFRTQQWGWSAADPVPADYDGDGKADIAVYHPARGDWYIRQSASLTFRKQQFGWSAAGPVPADYDGDQVADISVYHQAGGDWYTLLSGNGEWQKSRLGGPNWTPALTQYQINRLMGR